ncbi:Outer membrane protein TolC [Neorhodopirellula lusitana]|uniref:Outer membrane protein TolC n=1 Tax=Neorhodopirellula lusitana TaxID=445327 RepID=A0ABY1QFZ2_9BACT|nr:Outer membrane protein TolC [Neorhodopirellula lusitana]
MLTSRHSRRFALLENTLSCFCARDARRQWAVFTMAVTIVLGGGVSVHPVSRVSHAVWADELEGHTGEFAAFLSQVSEQNSGLELPDDPVRTAVPKAGIGSTSDSQDAAHGSEFGTPRFAMPVAGALAGRGTSADSAAAGMAAGEVTAGGLGAVVPWWEPRASEYLLNSPNFMQVDVPTLLTDTLESSPRISAISRRTSIAYEKIVQQQAAFDPTILLETGVGRVNDPVGSTLTTGGPPRLIQDSFTSSAGVRKITQLGTIVDLNQEIGTLSSNSQFFDPAHQGNSRLSLSITQPLMATSGRVYNTRLVTQASIESNVAWQQLRLDLESHLIDTLNTFWRLYERRAQLVQQRALIARGERIGKLVAARASYDSGPLQQIKVTRRLASDRDRLLELEAEVERLQVQLKSLVGSPSLMSMDQRIELIPLGDPNLPVETFEVRDCIVRGLEHRADIKAATRQLAASGLEVNVTKNELMPRLNAVIDAYLSGLNGSNAIGESFVDQFSEGGPGITAALTYNLPWGRRAAKSRYREARYRYQQRSEELRMSLLEARREIESSVIRVRAGAALRASKAATLLASRREEAIATRRWETLAGDGGPTALVLEDLLETQKRHTDAEQAYVTAQVNYMMELVTLQQAMGTFLIREGIEPTRVNCTSEVQILATTPGNLSDYPLENWSEPSANQHEADWNEKSVSGESLIGQPEMIENELPIVDPSGEH